MPCESTPRRSVSSIISAVVVGVRSDMPQARRTDTSCWRICVAGTRIVRSLRLPVRDPSGAHQAPLLRSGPPARTARANARNRVLVDLGPLGTSSRPPTILSPAPRPSGWRRWRRDPGESGVSICHPGGHHGPAHPSSPDSKSSPTAVATRPIPRVWGGPGNGETATAGETVTKAQTVMENLDAAGCGDQFHVAASTSGSRAPGAGREPAPVFRPDPRSAQAPAGWAPGAPPARPASASA